MKGRPYIALGLCQQGHALPTRVREWVQRNLIADDPQDVPPWEVAPPPELRLRQGWELEPIDPPHPWPVYAIVVVAFLALLALTGCGGSSDADADDMAATPAVDCVAHPELCK